MYAWLFTDLFAANSFVVFFAAVSFQDRYQENVKMSKSADFEAWVPHIRLHANLEFKQEVVHLPIIRCKTK